MTKAGWEKELIQKTAYQIWEIRGGSADDNWYTAIAILKELYLL